MYQIITLDGTELGMTDSVLYIKIGSSGSFTPCSVDEAIGVSPTVSSMALALR